MDTLYKDWLSCMSGGVRPVLSTSTTECFYRSLGNAYYAAFAPMLVELRGADVSSSWNEYYQPFEDHIYIYRPSLDYDTGLTWQRADYGWLKLNQVMDYASYCLSSGATDIIQQWLLDNIQIWKGGGLPNDYYSLLDSSCPMNQQWLPQAMRFGTKYSYLSSLEGTDMQPWWSTPSNTKYFGDPSFDGLRYTVYSGPYLPSKINHKWYCASWRALCKLLNTPSIAIGGSQKGWFWINPLYGGLDQNAAFQISAFENSGVSYWRKIDEILEPFDRLICGGQITGESMPYSVCGLMIGDAVYSSDNAASTRGNAYFNAPLLQPLEGMRAFFGANRTFAQEYVGIQNMEYKLPYSFLDRYQFGEWTDILSTGTDVEHWGGSNPTGIWPEYSFVSKPFRTAQNTLTEVCLQEDLRGNICTPPLRLVAENMFAHQWLWHSFLDGYPAGQQSSGLQNAIAWTPFKFTRYHYFRDYSFNVYGEAHLSTDDSDWVMVIDQDWSTASKSNYQWRPLEELTPYEPVLAHLEPNTVKYNADHSYAENVIQGDPYPKGQSQVCCVFEIPLPLSVDDGVAVFDTTYLSSSGYTRQEWAEIVRIAKSMFPKAAEWKRDKELSALQQEFDSQYSALSAMQQSVEEELSTFVKDEATLSVDYWYWSWDYAVDAAWPASVDVWEHFNDGIEATSAWTGQSPSPYENMLSVWAGTYWAQNGYGENTGWGIPAFINVGSFEYPQLTTFSDWPSHSFSIYQQMADYIAGSELVHDGQTDNYYSGEQIDYIREQLSAMCAALSVGGYAALQSSASQLQSLQQQYPVLTCTVSVDHQTSAEVSSWEYDDDAWKRVVVDMNDQLADDAQEWFDQSRRNLHQMSQMQWDQDWDEQTKWMFLNDISAAADSYLQQVWSAEYSDGLSAVEAYYRQHISELSAELQDINDQIDDLSAWYDEEYERIMEIEDDPLPISADLNKFLHYSIAGGHATVLSTDWSASLTMFAICPDTPSELLSSYPYGYDKWYEEEYYCDYPKTRWPLLDTGSWYMAAMKRTALEDVTAEGQSQLSSVVRGQVFARKANYDLFSGFDNWRWQLGMELRTEAGGYFGDSSSEPQPSQFFGSEVQNPSRWTIHDVLSVDTGTFSEGIELVEYDFYNINVRFVNNGDSEEWEARQIWVYCINGPTVYTEDCWHNCQKRWQSSTSVPWKFAEGQSAPEYYNRPPSADVDYSLPQLSGQLEINVGQQVIGSIDVNEMMSGM